MPERRAKDEGRIRLHSRFPSRYLSTPRDIVVYLPPGYDSDGQNHSVLYLQDGQNLFDPATAFMGQDWRADVTADYLILNGNIEPLILVGVYNTGVRRISEYTPTKDPRRRKGGKGDRYAQMLARELKPFIDREYRTNRACAHTGVGGSSLGGLVSLEGRAALSAGVRQNCRYFPFGVVGQQVGLELGAILRLALAAEDLAGRGHRGERLAATGC